jgi:predicted transcriptional regulator of viral defense system
MRKKEHKIDTEESKALKAVKRLQIARPRDMDALGIRRESLRSLLKQGALTRVSRGLYTTPDAEVSGYRSLAEVAKVVPGGIVCLLSALRYHGLTTQAPPEVWLAIAVHGWKPRNTPFPVRIVYGSGPALTEGIETHKVDGVPVRVYSAAKTVADCFKFRNKIGTEVAVEALKDYLKRHRRGADALWHFAKICRVSNVMRPYLEAAE